MTDGVSPTIISTALGLLGLLAGAIGTAVRVTATLSKVKEELADKMNADAADLRDQLAHDHDAIMKQFGDSLSAQAEKIRQVELYLRDNYVPQREYNRALDAIVSRMDSGFAKIEAKLDKLQGHA